MIEQIIQIVIHLKIKFFVSMQISSSVNLCNDCPYLNISMLFAVWHDVNFKNIQDDQPIQCQIMALFLNPFAGGG